MADDTYALIRQAVLNKDQVIAVYGGLPRQLCPHALGTKKGVPHGIFYQFGGTSSHPLGPPGSPLNWRCMMINELSEVRVIKGPWYSAPTDGNAMPHHTCIDTIDVTVNSFRWTLPEAA
jgi:hypothetical protein